MAREVQLRWIAPNAVAWDADVVWKEFVELLRAAPFKALSPLQQVAFLAFECDELARVHGARAYVERSGVLRARAAARALSKLGADEQARCIRAAARKSSSSREAAAAWTSIEPHLRRYLAAYEPHFVRVTPQSCNPR